jgi:hypothetical protein
METCFLVITFWTHWQASCECGSVFSLICRGTKPYLEWSNFPVLKQLTPILTLASPSLDIWLIIQYNYTNAQARTAMSMLFGLLQHAFSPPSTHSGTMMLCVFHSHEPHLYVHCFQNNPHNRNILQPHIYNTVPNIDLEHSLWPNGAKWIVTPSKTEGFANLWKLAYFLQPLFFLSRSI